MAKTKEKETAGKWGGEAPKRNLEMSVYYTGDTWEAPTVMECVIDRKRKKIGRSAPTNLDRHRN